MGISTGIVRGATERCATTLSCSHDMRMRAAPWRREHGTSGGAPPGYCCPLASPPRPRASPLRLGRPHGRGCGSRCGRRRSRCGSRCGIRRGSRRRRSRSSRRRRRRRIHLQRSAKCPEVVRFLVNAQRSKVKRWRSCDGVPTTQLVSKFGPHVQTCMRVAPQRPVWSPCLCGALAGAPLSRATVRCPHVDPCGLPACVVPSQRAPSLSRVPPFVPPWAVHVPRRVYVGRVSFPIIT